MIQENTFGTSPLNQPVKRRHRVRLDGIHDVEIRLHGLVVGVAGGRRHAPRGLTIPAEGVGGDARRGLFLDDQLRAGQRNHIVSPGKTHLVAEPLRKPERLRKAELLLGGVVRELRPVDIHILEIQHREAALLGQGDAGLAQGKIEMDAGVIDLILRLQCPHTVNGPGKISGMVHTRHPAGGQQGHAGDDRRKQHSFHNRSEQKQRYGKVIISEIISNCPPTIVRERGISLPSRPGTTGPARCGRRSDPAG